VDESNCADDGVSFWCPAPSASSSASTSAPPAQVPLTSADCATYDNNAGCTGCLVPPGYSGSPPHCWLDGATEAQCDPDLGDVWCGPSADETTAPAPKATATPASNGDDSDASDSLPPNALKESVAEGATVLPVVSNSPFQNGENIVIDAGSPTQEFNQIVGFGTLLLANPLKFAHGSGVLVDPTTVATSGATASLDAAGFKEVTSLCCPVEMEAWFTRLLESKGFEICSKPHLQGLMHWFSCVPDMDFQYVLDIIANGNPCKFWALAGAVCQPLSAECKGKFCR